MEHKSTESDNERLARCIVSTVLGVPVERHDYGTASRQVDALVCYPDRVAALEVVADPDKGFNDQQVALYGKKNPIEVPGLRKSWIVLVSRQAKINSVKRALPALLLDLQDNPRPKRSPWDVEPSDLDRLGITSADPIDKSTQSGRVWLLPASWGGWVGDEGTVGEWVTRVLVEKAADVPAKLAAHPGVVERHAFIWTIPSSDLGVQVQLEQGDDHPFPGAAPPTLPAGVTHVWVAGWASYQGVVAWFPDRGWWRIPWTGPSGGSA